MRTAIDPPEPARPSRIDGPARVTTTGSPAPPPKTSPQERDVQIVELSLAGVPIMRIGARFGRASRGAAMRLVERALDAELPPLTPDVQRRLDAARLEQLLQVWWPRALEGDAVAAAIVVVILHERRELSLDSDDADVSGS